jgi:hypothetical protein
MADLVVRMAVDGTFASRLCQFAKTDEIFPSAPIDVHAAP